MSDLKLRYFDSAEVASFYAASRPYFHPLVMDRVREVAKLSGRMDHGLDVGCGTGLSSVALLDLVYRVIGTDISPAMLRAARKEQGVSYIAATAERQPILDQSQDVLTISSAYHWVDPERFLHEVRRVLKPGGLFAVYENGFSGEMIGNPAFIDWARGEYVGRYPTPARRAGFSPHVAQVGFETLISERYENVVRFTPLQLAEYLTTQSNVINAVESGRITYEACREWLHEAVKPQFENEGGANFRFVGSIHLLRRLP